MIYSFLSFEHSFWIHFDHRISVPIHDQPDTMLLYAEIYWIANQSVTHIGCSKFFGANICGMMLYHLSPSFSEPFITESTWWDNRFLPKMLVKNLILLVISAKGPHTLQTREPLVKLTSYIFHFLAGTRIRCMRSPTLSARSKKCFANAMNRIDLPLLHTTLVLDGSYNHSCTSLLSSETISNQIHCICTWCIFFFLHLLLDNLTVSFYSKQNITSLQGFAIWLFTLHVLLV